MNSEDVDSNEKLSTARREVKALIAGAYMTPIFWEEGFGLDLCGRYTRIRRILDQYPTLWAEIDKESIARFEVKLLIRGRYQDVMDDREQIEYMRTILTKYPSLFDGEGRDEWLLFWQFHVGTNHHCSKISAARSKVQTLIDGDVEVVRDMDVPQRVAEIRSILTEYPSLCAEYDVIGRSFLIHYAVACDEESSTCKVPMQVMELFVSQCPDLFARAKVRRLIAGVEDYVNLDVPQRVAMIRNILDEHPSLSEANGCKRPLLYHAVECDLNLHLLPQQRHVPMEIMELLVSYRPDQLTVKWFHSAATLLHRACDHLYGPVRLEVVELLATKETVQVRNDKGDLPLHTYLKGHDYFQPAPLDLQVVRVLTELNPDALRMKGTVQHRTPLGLVCSSRVRDKNKTEVIRYLVQMCPEVLYPADNTSTELHKMCSTLHWDEHNDSTAVLKALAISEKAVMAKDDNGETALHILSFWGNVSRERLHPLLDKCPHLPDVRDNKGRTPLFAALEGYVADRARQTVSFPWTWSTSSNVLLNDYLATVQCLLEAFPPGVHIKNAHGKSPVDFACENDVDLNLIYEIVGVNPVAVLNDLFQNENEDTGDGNQEAVRSQGILGAAASPYRWTLWELD